MLLRRNSVKSGKGRGVILRTSVIAAKWLFMLCLPILLLTASIATAVNSLWLYKSGFEKYGISQTTGLDEAELEKAGARVIRLQGNAGGRINLALLLPTLSDLGIHSLMVEGGAKVITSFLAEQLVDQFVITIAPVFIGGQRFLERLLISKSYPDMEESSKRALNIPRLKIIRYELLGQDLIVWGERIPITS